ncbi:MAG: PAS domain S-box protein [Mariprofundaceae bacterium]
MVYVKQLEGHISRVHSEVATVSDHAVSDVSISHLWLEEILAGDPHESVDAVFKHLNHVKYDLEMVRSLGPHSHLLLSHPALDDLPALHDEALITYNQLLVLTKQRLSERGTSGIGTSIDQQYDAIFNRFLAQMGKVRSLLVSSLKIHLDNLEVTQIILILLSLLIMLAVAWMMRSSFQKQRRSYETALASEKSRQAAEKRTRIILENALDAVITTDHQSNILSWNRQAELIFGWSKKEAVGQVLMGLIIPERYRERHEVSMERFATTGDNGNIIGNRVEISALRSSGEEFPVELCVTHHKVGEQQYFTAFIRDITERIAAEKNQKENEQRLNEAQQIAQVGSWELDLVTNELIWSDEIFRMFEIDKDKFGASYEAFLDAIHPDDRERVNEAYTRSLETKQPYEIVHRLLMKDGRIKHVNERCESFFSDEQGTPLRSIGTVQDITELVEAHQEKEDVRAKMEHVQRLESLGVMAGGIAHDFNNILTTILGNAGLATSKLTDTSPAVEYIERIAKASRKAADLCKQMLAYSGKGKFVVKPIILSELVEEMSQLLKVTIAKNVVLRLDLNNQIPAIEADITQMQQVIMNLVINASEAIGDRSGAISIATGMVHMDKQYLSTTYLDEGLEEGRYIYLEVSDTGCGMDEETKERLFEPFFTTKFTGRGLGMSAILGIVRGHQGAIKAYSEVGKGTTFKVLFPCSKQKPVSLNGEQKSEAAWHAEGVVLIVDDEDTVREVAASMLEEMGLETLKAVDGIEGVEMFNQHHDRITAVLLDMTMPKMNGEDAFSEMCRIDPDVKVILSSGYNEQDATNRFSGKGLAGFLQKPYTAEELAEKLKDIFNKR